MAKKPDGSTKFTELRRVQMELEAARARKLGGTLSVLSRPAKCTRVVLDFPKKTSVEDVKLLPRLEPVVRRAM